MLRSCGNGFGLLALSALMAEAPASDTVREQPHMRPRAKNVIFLFMDGGVSHVDSFDPKPELKKHDGQSIGNWKPSVRSQSISPARKWKQSPWSFGRYGECGLPVSELFPRIAQQADDLCVIRSLVGEIPLHGAQNLLLHTGRLTGGAPSVGSWVSYGLGTENKNLPGFVLLNNDWVPNGGMQLFSSSYLPAVHQASMIRAKGAPVDNIEPADPPAIQRAKLDLLADRDRAFGVTARDSVIESAIRNYEIAWQMQRLVPEIADVGCETSATQKLYGVDRTDPFQHYYALQCLRARRLVEAGVRFVEVTCPLTHNNNSPWDQHTDLKRRHEENARITDQPVAALLADLKARGLLDETIVIWAGEMGRTPHCATPDGRDHHVGGYSIWVAGGGVKPAVTFGRTDELGMDAVEKPVDIHDVHATVLHCLGIDHERLTFRFGGRDMRLTDVHGKIIREILA
jgi:hypothetical protein